MNTINTNAIQLMQDMQRLANAAQGPDVTSLSGGLGTALLPSSGSEQALPTSNFADLLKASLDQVNAAQNTSQDLEMQYETGMSGVDLSDVMIAMQKASLSLQMVQNVRGRLVSAYQDLMNTPI